MPSFITKDSAKKGAEPRKNADVCTTLARGSQPQRVLVDELMQPWQLLLLKAASWGGGQELGWPLALSSLSLLAAKETT